jgi:hypothetical protein
LKDIRLIHCLNISQKVPNWFGNNAAKLKQPDVNSVKNAGKKLKVFSARDVVKLSHQEQIRDLISQKTDDQPGFGGWISHYPGAVTTVMAGLSDAELKEAEETAKGWNENRPPKEAQQT